MSKSAKNLPSLPDEGNVEDENFNVSMLADEPPLLVFPSLATAIGLEEAIVVQQLRYFLKGKGNGKMINGHKWIFNTYEQWQEILPFMSLRTIRRVFSNLETMQIVISCQPERHFSRRKYYRLNAAMVIRFQKGAVPKPKKHLANLAASSVQNGRLDSPDWPLPVTKSTSETAIRESKESKVTGAVAPAVVLPEFDARWQRTAGTKEQKLAWIRPPTNSPTEPEFDRFLAEADLYCVISNRQDLYWELSCNKWHQWREHLKKWVPIRDWKKYVAALENTFLNQAH